MFLNAARENTEQYAKRQRIARIARGVAGLAKTFTLFDHIYWEQNISCECRAASRRRARTLLLQKSWNSFSLSFFFFVFTLSSLLEYNLRTVITLSFPHDHCNALYSYYYNQKQPRAAQFSRRKRRDSCVGICHVAKSPPTLSNPPRCADTFKKLHRVPVIWAPPIGPPTKSGCDKQVSTAPHLHRKWTGHTRKEQKTKQSKTLSWTTAKLRTRTVVKQSDEWLECKTKHTLLTVERRSPAQTVHIHRHLGCR